MEPERWHRVEELYHSALKIAANRRAAFLKDECQGDEELREEVESLFSCENAAAEFIESPAFDVAAKLPADTTPEAPKQMLQALLEDRFHLVTRKATRHCPPLP